MTGGALARSDVAPEGVGASLAERPALYEGRTRVYRAAYYEGEVCVYHADLNCPCLPRNELVVHPVDAARRAGHMTPCVHCTKQEGRR
jgi:hypothetical protein